jgi:hypothetical protein
MPRLQGKPTKEENISICQSVIDGAIDRYRREANTSSNEVNMERLRRIVVGRTSLAGYVKTGVFEMLDLDNNGIDDHLRLIKKPDGGYDVCFV